MKKETLLKLACWIVPITAFVMTFLFVEEHFIYSINSDDASELILGRLLAKEGGIISSNWYYSTELRTLNTNLFYGFFFRFTDNWHTVRMLSYATMYTLLLLSMWFLGKITGNEKNYLLMGSLFLLPLPGEYFYLFLDAAYYLPYIILSVLTIAMGEWYIRTRKKWIGILNLCLAGGLSFVSGMGGARQLIVLYIPMMIAAVVLCFSKIMKEKRAWLLFASVVFACAMMGFAANLTVLRKNYSFMTWGNIGFVLPTAKRFEEILNGFFVEFGFSAGAVFYIPAVINNVIFALWLGLTITAIVYAIRKRDEVDSAYLRIVVFILAAVAVFTMLYLFSDMSYQNRYNLPIVLISIPLLACFFRNIKWKKWIQRTVMAVFIGIFFLNSISTYQANAKTDNTKNFREVSEYLLQEDYYSGYATFWNANILTELSNGKIEVWDWMESWDENFNDIDQTYKWLQLKSHDTERPKGKVFMLLDPAQYENNSWDKDILHEHVIFENPSFKVLGFADYNELKQTVFGGKGLS